MRENYVLYSPASNISRESSGMMFGMILSISFICFVSGTFPFCMVSAVGIPFIPVEIPKLI